MSSGRSADHNVYIYRKANGGLYVHPSPLLMKAGQTLQFRNLTDGDGAVVFRKAGVEKRVEIKSQQASRLVKPKVDAGRCYDYRLVLAVRGDELVAEGGSDPSILIDV
jgi:hypothetical protein